jgi:hypothetical protein
MRRSRRQNAAVSSGMTDDEERRLPHGGMAEGLLEHAVRFSLNRWLVASNNAMLPLEGTPVHVEPSASGYKLEFKIQTFDVKMSLARDLSFQSQALQSIWSEMKNQALSLLAVPKFRTKLSVGTSNALEGATPMNRFGASGTIEGPYGPQSVPFGRR